MRKDHAYDRPMVLVPIGVGEAQNRRVVIRSSKPEEGRFVCDPPKIRQARAARAAGLFSQTAPDAAIFISTPIVREPLP